MKKLKKVVVSWKYSSTRFEDGFTFLNVKFPVVTFSGDDLKGKSRWDDKQWSIRAMNEFKLQKGFESEQRDLLVQKIYE